MKRGKILKIEDLLKASDEKGSLIQDLGAPSDSEIVKMLERCSDPGARRIAEHWKREHGGKPGKKNP